MLAGKMGYLVLISLGIVPQQDGNLPLNLSACIVHACARLNMKMSMLFGRIMVSLKTFNFQTASCGLLHSHMQEALPHHLLIYTDGWVDYTKCSATAAAIIPAHGYKWKERLSFKTASTTAALEAIQLALQHLLTFQAPSEAVVLTESLVALLQLQRQDELN